MKKKIENIENNLNKCRKQGIPEHDEDICVAESTREFLKYKDSKLPTNIFVFFYN